MATVRGFKAATDRFQKLMEKRDITERKAMRERRREAVMNARAAELAQAIGVLKHAKRGQGGAFADRESARKAEREIHMLEAEKNRLMIAVDKLDDDMRGKRLRINEARLHRLSQDRVFAEMRRELDEIKLALSARLEVSNQLVEETDEYEKMRGVASAGADDDVLAFDDEFTALTDELEALQERQRAAFNTQQSSGLDFSKPKLNEEQKVKAQLRIQQLDRWIDEAGRFIEETDKKTERLGDVFQLMMTRSGVDSLDELVKIFRENEAYNFKIYTYIQHLNREIKTEDRGLVETLQQIDDFKITHGRMDAEKRDRMLRMSEDLSHTEDMTTSYNKASGTNLVTVKEMVNVAKRLANAVDSATAALEGDNAKNREAFAKATDLSQLGDFVTEEAMTNCMGLVEERAHHAIKMFSDVIKMADGRSAIAAYQAQQKANAALRNSGHHGRLPPASPTRGPSGTGSAELEFAVTAPEVDRILHEASKGPTMAKSDVPLGMTKLPSFGHLQVSADDEFVPDERPMRRFELYQLAQQDLDSGSLTLKSSVDGSGFGGANGGGGGDGGGGRLPSSGKGKPHRKSRTRA